MDGIQLVALALRVVSERLMTIIALGLSFGLACWTMKAPSYEALACLLIFAVYSYLLLVVKETKNENPKASE